MDTPKVESHYAMVDVVWRSTFKTDGIKFHVVFDADAICLNEQVVAE